MKLNIAFAILLWILTISNLTCASKENQNDEIDEDIENDENKIHHNFDDSSE